MFDEAEIKEINEDFHFTIIQVNYGKTLNINYSK